MCIRDRLCGLGTTVILALAWGLDTSKSTIIASISMVVSMLATVFVSLGTKKFSKEHVDCLLYTSRCV